MKSLLSFLGFKEKCVHDWNVLSKTVTKTWIYKDTSQYVIGSGYDRWLGYVTNILCKCNKCGEIKQYEQPGLPTDSADIPSL